MSDSLHPRCDQDVVNLCRLAQVFGDRQQPACILLCTPDVAAFTVYSNRGNAERTRQPVNPDLQTEAVQAERRGLWKKIPAFFQSLRARWSKRPETAALPAVPPPVDHLSTLLMLAEITAPRGEGPVRIEPDGTSPGTGDPSAVAPLSLEDQEWLGTVGRFSRRHGERWEVGPDELAPFWPLAQTA